jgi:uncharacterized membrane protein YtjA (UPF0391 family)
VGECVGEGVGKYIKAAGDWLADAAGDAKDQYTSLVPTHEAHITHTKEQHMLYWAAGFLIIALIAAVLGFGGIAGTAVEIAKILFFVFLVLFLISAALSMFRKGSSGVRP